MYVRFIVGIRFPPFFIFLKIFDIKKGANFSPSYTEATSYK